LNVNNFSYVFVVRYRGEFVSTFFYFRGNLNIQFFSPKYCMENFNWFLAIFTDFLSFLERERDCTVNVFHYSFLGVLKIQRYNRSPFLAVCMNVPWAFHERLLPFSAVSDLLKLETVRNVGRSGTIKNGQERWTVRDVGRSETIKKSPSRYVHAQAHASKTKETLY
jgi:hypothetical protein